MRHLDPDLLHTLLAGELHPGEGTALAAHLRAGCLLCEAVVVEHGEQLDLDDLARLIEAEDAPPVSPGEQTRETLFDAILHRPTPAPAPRLAHPGSRFERPLHLPPRIAGAPPAIHVDDPDAPAPVAPLPEDLADPSAQLPRAPVEPAPVVLLHPNPADVEPPTEPIAFDRRHRPPDAQLTPPPARRRLWIPTIGLLAAAALALVLLPREHTPEPTAGDGLKGDPVEVAEQPPVSLRAIDGRMVDGVFQRQARLADGGVLAPDHTLLFEMDTATRGGRYLFVVDAEGEATVLVPPEGQPPQLDSRGRRPVTWRGEWVGYTPDKPGAITIVAAIAPAPLPPADEIVQSWREERDAAHFASLRLTVSP